MSGKSWKCKHNKPFRKRRLILSYKGENMQKQKVAYFEINNDGLSMNSDIQKAIDGLSGNEYELNMISYSDIVLGKYINIRENPFICSFNTMRKLFIDNQIKIEPIDYPEEIMKFSGRRISLFTVEEIISLYKKEVLCGYYKNCFIKPYITKQFITFWLNDNTLSLLESFDGNTKIWVSQLIDIESEWRIFVHKNRVVGSSYYSGNFKLTPDYDYINDIVSTYKSSPVGYTLDIGMLSHDANTIIEVNDFWGIGSYGLNPERYAAMLIDRYFEIVTKK